MKKLAVLMIAFFAIGSADAQMIDLELASPGPEFQDSDVGSSALADVDNDGDLDFLATGKGGPVLTTLYLNDGIGNFSEVTTSPFVNVFGGRVKFADLNNDTFLDLVITGSNTGGTKTANLYMNDGTGAYTMSTGVPFVPNWSGDIATGDIDLDGDVDVFITGLDASESPVSVLYLNDGTGVFTEVFGTPFEALGLSSSDFIDVENDGDLDLVISGSNDDDLFANLYENDGAGVFSLVSGTPFEGSQAGGIAVADVDNDGDTDLLINGEAATESLAQLFINDGLGNFTLLAGTPFIGTSIGATEFGDLDNDGDADVVITGLGATGVIAQIYENLGSNNFSLVDEIGEAYLSSIAIGDMDGDLDKDLIMGGTSFVVPVRATKTYYNLFSDNSVQVNGCTNSEACNYNELANTPDDSCEYGCYGCTDDSALNFDIQHTIDDGSCVFCESAGCEGDFNNDNAVNAADLLVFLTVFGSICE